MPRWKMATFPKKWMLAAGGLLWLAGCSQAPDLQYVSSAEIQALQPELQEAIAEQLTKHCGTPVRPKLLGHDDRDAARLARGAAIYQDRCAACHGVTGDGNGPAATYMYPRPRDYRKGLFKFSSTPYGNRPLRSDLKRTIMHGARGTSMPAFKLLPDEDLELLLDHVMVLTHRGEFELLLALQAEGDDMVDPEMVPDLIDQTLAPWRDLQQVVVIPKTRMPAYSEETVELGKQAFLSEIAGCHKCHGTDGRGQTMDNEKGFEDSWKFKTRAADLTSGMFHGGGEPDDIYRRIFAGITGTPMPAFEQKLADRPETFWHLVHYVQYLSAARRRSTVSGEPLPPPETAPIAAVEGEAASQPDAVGEPEGEPPAAEEPAEDTPVEGEPAEEKPGEDTPAEEPRSSATDEGEESP
ncbi:MAG: cytochrome c [Pirellulales bacterium]